MMTTTAKRKGFSVLSCVGVLGNVSLSGVVQSLLVNTSSPIRTAQGTQTPDLQVQCIQD